MNRRRLEAELGQENICPPAEQFRLGNFPPGGEIEAIVITNDPLFMGGPIFINIFTNTILSQTLDWFRQGSASWRRSFVP